ncbi:MULTISPECIES: flagellar hook-associated protein FlgL [Vibrio]|uniref:Flagellar hook-associated protein 3 n=1 Tax=Vibrio natriegens NBRC 15636 = ATCC 14048 = DSM 759 TaxID=1219067 RepID=A0AAN0Y1A8_VIBNA|nr:MULTISPECIES: flagellar hook-associated protein FlgL [Vibrio]AEX21217.1 flagellar hook-associated protein FlgL [Vibrio sp. EJY3]ALR16214.1 flagellar hook protein FlgL [Vibrio natriegens NBRC 15636 = ATCC 14048 = DSM 759]ANQ11924.1 flagellar hook-associated protein 3 [Vibrio natriegens NBRC 15636 = ATCC 14048 = DSM 759]EPM42191.1 flagellar hook-associated protein FlgL [Vibrio natriegens NBRC 15636 = ATCC 14048 = DSM 759]MDX6026274.1 flagellar hook-associated protein FlgL [Vibrio natriegens N
MLTRISSFHNYQSVQNDLRRQENKVHHNQEQLASGKKLLKPSDDPLAAHYVQNIGQQQEQIQQYLSSITLVRNRLENHEVNIANAESFADESKRLTMEMINGALSVEDRQAKKRELEEIANNFLSLVNAQDESGNYVFAGTKSKSQPFYRDKDGSVQYAGDDYQRKMKVSNMLEMPMNDPGSKLFMEIPNPFGDYQPNYELQNGSELLLGKATNADTEDTASYRVTFVDMNNGKFGYQLERNGSVVKADEFSPEKGIEYKELKMQVKGQITPGDSIGIEKRESFNIFDTFKQAMSWSEQSVSDTSSTAKLHQMTEEFQAAFIHLNKARTDVGARLSTLDIQEQNHEDFNLSLAKAKSNFEDLDYSKAVIEFSENSRALQASQQAFGKTKDLTLFNYI